MATIITNIGLISVWFLTLFKDLWDAVILNDWIIFPIVFGFLMMGCTAVIRLVRKARNSG